MKIGIIGSGNMGRTLGGRWAQLHHDVFFGSRKQEVAERAAALAGNGAKAGSNQEAATFGEALLWTIRDPDVVSVVGSSEVLNGKVIMDLNNRDYMHEVHTPGHWFDKSIAERLQEAAKGAKVVKAFNTVAMGSFNTSPELLRTANAQIFLAGEDAGAKKVVTRLADDMGFAAVDGGGIFSARYVEALADILRIIMVQGERGMQAHIHTTMLPTPNLSEIGNIQASNYH